MTHVEITPESLALPSPRLQSGKALHRQITRHLRTLIHAGNLPSGSKLPRMHDLAAHWRTNYFTVHTALSVLVREGLLERKPRIGTFVRAQCKGMTCIGIYYGDEILAKGEKEFYRSLHAQLSLLLHESNLSMRIFIDSRPDDLQREPLQELEDSINSRAIQGLIIPLAHHSMSWADNMPIPTSMFNSRRTECSRIYIDNEQFVTIACETLRDQGCRKLGLINPTALSDPNGGKNEDDSILNAFHSCIRKFNLTAQKSWIRIPEITAEHQKNYGYQEFHKLWANTEKPDGLIAYPESVARGVALAILEKKIKVPEDLKLVLHKNHEVSFLCPLPTNWIITRERDIAEALIKQIQDRFDGLEPRTYIIQQTLVRATQPEALISLQGEISGTLS